MRFGQGATRNVIIIGKYALKYPRLCEWRLFLHGLLANMQESLFSGCDDFPDLCPVIWSIPGGFLICMRAADPLSREDWDSMADDWLTSRRLKDLCEGKPDCFGKLNGKIVVVDYGRQN